MPANLFDASDYSAANPDLKAAGLLTQEQLFSHFQNFGLNEGRSFSSLVNLNFYRASNIDLANFSNQQLFDHLQNFGISEGRQFSQFFDLHFYRTGNPDLASFNNQQLFDHLQNFGISEGRQFSQFFDLNFYRAGNPDLASFNNQQLFDHLQSFGISEGRRFSQFFDLSFYQESNKDLAGMNNDQLLKHLQNYGLSENRKYSQFFDADYYLKNNTDLMEAGFKGRQLLEHIQLFGLDEGRQFNIAFNLNDYRNVNTDLKTANLSNKQLLEHFQLYGLSEGKVSSSNFNIKVYLANNSDLIAAGLNNQQTYTHFLTYGLNEGRPGGDYAGNTLIKARNVRLGMQEISFTDWVGNIDTNDFYKLNLVGVNDLTITLNTFSDVNIQLIQDINNNGVVEAEEAIASSTNTSASLKEIKLNSLASGTYFVQVSSGTDANSYYDVNFVATPTPPPITSTIQGRKWNDANGNGIQDVGEPGLAGWTIYLDANNNGQLDSGETSTITGLDGKYSFTNLAPGTYTVATQTQANWKETFPSKGGQGSNTLIAIADRRDLIFDQQRNRLYITTSDGDVERYDIATGKLLAPFDAGNSLYGGDITPDGNFLYIAEGQRGATQGFIRKVNLNNGTISNLTFNLSYDDLPSDVAFGVNGIGMIKSFGQWGPMRELNLSNDTIRERSDIWSIYGGSQIARSADRSLFFMTQDGISSGPIFTYDAITNKFSPEKRTETYLGSNLSAVNRNGSLIALEWGNGVSIMDRNLNSVENLTNIDGGIAFDPVRDILYGANSSTDEIIAFDTNTWKELYRFTIGENIASELYGHSSTPYNNGMMSVSHDGQLLFMSTSSGVRMFQLKNPDTYTVQLNLDQTINNINFAAKALPVVDPKGLSLEENTAAIISSNLLNVIDADSQPYQLTYTLKSLPINGTLKLNNVPLTANQTFTQNDINNNRLSYQHNGSETLTDNFSFTLKDESDTVPDSKTFTFTITSVNDAPVESINKGRIVRQGTTAKITNFSLMVTDVDNTATQLIYTLVTAPINGSLKLNGTSLSVGQTFTQDDINNNSLSYQHNGSATTSDRFNYKITDGVVTKSGSFNIGITPATGIPSLVRDINPGSANSSPINLANVNGTLYFAANNGSNGTELWQSDGTASGTNIVKDIIPGLANSFPANFTAMNGTVYFTANNSINGVELWKTDGTSTGTVLLKDIYQGSASSFPTNLINVNGTLYFAAQDTYGTELWKSNGTQAGTVLVKDINPGTNGSSPANFTNVNGTLYFTASDPNNKYALWKTDGTAAGTVLVKQIYPETSNSFSTNLININNTLYFYAYDAESGIELWKSDGTAAGTTIVKDINLGAASSQFNQLVKVNDTLYFSVYKGDNKYQLWKSDGTASNTVLIRQFALSSSSSSISKLTDVNGNLYFNLNDSVFGNQLWKSDGTDAGTFIVKSFSAANTSSLNQLTNVNSTLYFTLTDGTYGNELWKSDGTTEGTVIVKDIRVGTASSSPNNLTNVDGILYFSANDGSNGVELWTV